MSAKLNLFLFPETETMKRNLSAIATGALALAATHSAHAQYAPPPPTQPFPGFANQYLRAQDPYWANWDFGAQLRLRYEIKDNGGATFTGPAADFRRNVSTGAAGTDNATITGTGVAPKAVCVRPGGTVTFANFYLLTLYVQQVLHYSALRTGLTFVAITSFHGPIGGMWLAP